MPLRKLLYLVIFTLFLSCSDDSPSGSQREISTIPDSLTYVAFGASDVVGIGATDTISGLPDTLNGYVHLINRELKEMTKYVDFQKVAVSGYTIEDMLDTLLHEAIIRQPDLMTVWTGGNDFVSIMRNYMNITTFETGIDSLLGTLYDSIPGVNIVIANLPDMSKIPSVTENGDAVVAQAEILITELNTLIEEAATKHGATLVDLFSNQTLVSDLSNIADDGFHPSSKGYKLMATLYLEEIKDIY